MDGMLLIRRQVTRNRGYTVLMLPGYHRMLPTSEQEHAEILRLYCQDRRYPGIENDFTGPGALTGDARPEERAPRVGEKRA